MYGPMKLWMERIRTTEKEIFALQIKSHMKKTQREIGWVFLISFVYTHTQHIYICTTIFYGNKLKSNLGTNNLI